MLIKKLFRKISYEQFYMNTLSEIDQHMYVRVLRNIYGPWNMTLVKNVNNINTNQLIEEWK